MARLALQGLEKRYGAATVVKDVSLDVADGEFIVVLGPSGCGKTTTLRMVAGFVVPTAGAIHIGERDVTRLPPWKRDTGLVFQSYALFPHLSVAENVAFGLEMRKMPKSDIGPKVEEALRLVRLGGYGERYPRQLSGGQQQRVALARALAIHPDVLLLDEPLSNLDAKLREEVRVEIRELQRKLELTTVMVTHDQDEALVMADRLVVMADGEVKQIGDQRALYERPENLFVAGFVGRSNIVIGRVDAPGRFVSDGGLGITCACAQAGPGCLTLRPERLTLGDGNGSANSFQGTVEFVSYLGAAIDVHVRLSESDRVVVALPNKPGVPTPNIGAQVTVSWPVEAGLVFPEASN
jgi:putative spermidine/putrescine transport system ATP-binding protein